MGKGEEITKKFQLAASEETEKARVAHRLLRSTIAHEGRRLLIAMHDNERAFHIAQLLVGQELFDAFTIVENPEELDCALSDDEGYALVVADSVLYKICESVLPQRIVPTNSATPPRLVRLNETDEQTIENIRALQVAPA